MFRGNKEPHISKKSLFRNFLNCREVRRHKIIVEKNGPVLCWEKFIFGGQNKEHTQSWSSSPAFYSVIKGRHDKMALPGFEGMVHLA